MEGRLICLRNPRLLLKWRGLVMHASSEGLMTSSSRKTLVIFTAQYLPHLGGVENFTKGLATALVSRGVRVAIVTSQYEDAPETEKEDGVEIFRLPTIQLLAGRLPVVCENMKTRELLEKVKDLSPQGVLVNTRLYRLSLLGVKFAREIGLTPVLLDHSSSYVGFGIPAVDAAAHIYERLITSRISKSNPRYYGISKMSASWLENFGLNAEGVIHNAIDSEAFRGLASSRDFRSELGVSDGELLVCFVGRIVREKGIDTLLQTAEILDRKHLGVKFAVAGDGPAISLLKSHALPSVKLLGRLERNDVAALFRDSDLHFFPSRYPEGLPTSLLESSAMGTPSLVTDVGGAKEVIPDDTFGIVLREPSASVCAEMISWYCENPDVLKAQGMNARELVEKEFCWDNTARQVINACNI